MAAPGRSWPHADRHPATPTDCFPKPKGQSAKKTDTPDGCLRLNAVDHRRLGGKVATVCWPRPPSASNSTRLSGRVTPQALPQAITLEHIEASAEHTPLQLAA